MKKKKEVYKIHHLLKEENIIAGLLSEYDIKTAEDNLKKLSKIY